LLYFSSSQLIHNVSFIYVRYEVLLLVNKNIMVFWDVMSCSSSHSGAAGGGGDMKVGTEIMPPFFNVTSGRAVE
jgi:hypothetical protein